MHLNEHGQPVGDPLPDWEAPPPPPRETLTGRLVRLEPLDPARHADDLFEACGHPEDDPTWTYLSVGPFRDPALHRSWLEACAAGDDPLFLAIVERASGRALGQAAWLRIAPAAGSVEVGHILFGRGLRRSRAATEAMSLMMGRAFALGYRRYEWKCDALNAPSRRAALRLGFTEEGVFRQALVTRGRNRDTAWFSILDGEWPALERAHERWLDEGNFDAGGRQRESLADLTRAALDSLPAAARGQ